MVATELLDRCKQNEDCYTGYCSVGICRIPSLGDPCRFGTCARPALICVEGKCKSEPSFLIGAQPCKTSSSCPSSQYCNNADELYLCLSRKGLGGACRQENQCNDGLVCNGEYCILKCGAERKPCKGGTCKRLPSGNLGCVKEVDHFRSLIPVLLEILLPPLALLSIFMLILLYRRKKQPFTKKRTVSKDVEDPLPVNPPHLMTPIAEE